jgi:UDP-N-acetylglucosamine 4,6-dehydratase
MYDHLFENKTLLITGGTGSFGETILRRFLKTSISEIRVFSRDEKKQEDLRLALNHEKLKFYIGDVRDHHSLIEATYGVDYIFHAAALKQVPSCEFYPMEAIKTNVMGTENVLNAAIANKVKHVVVLSTDKAVYPANAMGLSKALAEKIVVAKSRIIPKSNTLMCITRYGNVMASRGSVIPLFIKQIKQGEPITITDPSMTRFLMSLDDSVDLVIHAFQNANSGDIFVQKPQASTVGDLAQALIELFDSKSPIKIIGTRHGEKLCESLISREEMLRAEETNGYYRIPMDDRDLNYSKYFVNGEVELSAMEDYTSHNIKRLSVESIKDLLLQVDYVRNELQC